MNNDHIEHDIMAGLALPARLIAGARTPKEGFTDGELSQIFTAMMPFRTHKAPVMQEWYWAILLLAHSGCRAKEVIQLLTADIQQEEGVWCFNVRWKEAGVDAKAEPQLKNRKSDRQVPILSHLLKAGFLDWYNTRTDRRLFPLLLPYGVVKTSMTFSRLLKKLKLKRPALSLHSLRHTMTIKLERARVHFSIMRRLLGHSIGKAVEDRVYLGSLKYDIKELSEEMEKVKFPTV